MNTQDVHDMLQNQINSLDVSKCAKDPSRDFSRVRKLPLKVLVSTILHMEGRSLRNELITMFPKAAETPSPAAFVQQCNKLKAGVFDDMFHSFVQAVEERKPPRVFRGMRLLAVDGSSISLPRDLSDEKTLCYRGRDKTPQNAMHLNAMFDLLQGTYVDEIVQDFREANEKAAFVAMVDRSRIAKALVLADRGYESYNNFAHVVE